MLSSNSETQKLNYIYNLYAILFLFRQKIDLFYLIVLSTYFLNLYVAFNLCVTHKNYIRYKISFFIFSDIMIY